MNKSTHLILDNVDYEGLLACVHYELTIGRLDWKSLNSDFISLGKAYGFEIVHHVALISQLSDNIV